MLLLLVLLSGSGYGALCRPDGGGYSYPNPHQQEPIIQKHIYVHVPPPDPEFHAQPQKVIPAPPPKKHYKIVFIKAPTYTPPVAPVLPEQQQNQEKTLIYVLHKNPSDAPPIVIPTARPTQPSKPEVYFIRYKTQKEIGYAGGDGSGGSGGHGGSIGGLAGGHGGIGGGHGPSLGVLGGSHGPSLGGGHGPSLGGGHGGFGGIHGDSGYSPSSPSSTSVYSSTASSASLSTPRPSFLRVRSSTPKFITPTPSSED